MTLHRIRRIGVLKAGVIGGVAYAILSLVFVPFALLFMLASGPLAGEMGGDWLMAPAMLLLAPLVYGVLGFLGTALTAAVYNLIAAMVGGLEVELEPAGV